MGYSVNKIRIVATALGGFLAGVGGSYLSLYYPGFLERADFLGPRLMAVALVIFAAGNRCVVYGRRCCSAASARSAWRCKART